MRRRPFLSSMLLAAGCNGGDAISPPRPVDAPESADARDPADAADTDAPRSRDAASDAPPGADAASACARAPLGEWSGVALHKDEGGGTYSAVRADVRWKLDSSEGCIDRYYPTGTVTYSFVGPCDEVVTPATMQLMPSDGVLTIDRSREPIAYEIRGATTWDASITCAGDPPDEPFTVGGPWALGRGTFDGDVVSGGFHAADDDSAHWDFVRVNHSFPEDDSDSDCAEPPLDRLWGTGRVSQGADSHGADATVTWTRVDTSGCTDRFVPSGVATAPTKNADCSAIFTQPPSAAIFEEHGELTIDRDRRPALVRFHGNTPWPGARTCTQPDGTMYIEHGEMGGPWAWHVRARFDGTAFSGTTTHNNVDYAWSLTRLPPAAASSPAR